MRKRVPAQSGGGNASASSRLRAKAKTTGGQEKEGASLVWLWVKRVSLALCVICLMVPVVAQLPETIRQRLYYHRIRAPFLFDLSRPAELSLNHTINMYLTPEEGISLGVWHTVPDNKWKEAQGKDLSWYRSVLKDGRPVVIYLHGKTQTRAAPHRVGAVKILSAIGYQVLSMDYRDQIEGFVEGIGTISALTDKEMNEAVFTILAEILQQLRLQGYGDSNGKPTEESLTTDAVWLYHWAKEHSGGSRVIIWGHSLGSGVTTNTAVRLMEQGVIVDGVILDGAFIHIPSRAPLNPFVLCALYWEAVERFLLRDTFEKDVKFPNDENVEKMTSPLLFIHSEDDHLAGIHLARQMYETARSVQDPERVRMAVFEGSHGYLHNGLYRDPRLPAIIKSFVESTEEML